jgi:hypothetical protein
VVRVLLERAELRLDQRDTEGFTALFHACNHGKNRVGDQHGYFRRLWSWDLRDILLIILKYLFLLNLEGLLLTSEHPFGLLDFLRIRVLLCH